MEPVWGWERLVRRNARHCRERTDRGVGNSLYIIILDVGKCADEPTQYLSAFA